MSVITNMRQKRRVTFGLMTALVMIIIVALGVIQANADGPAPAPAVGIVCTENSSSTFTVTAQDGYINMADGNQVYMWSYAGGNDDFQFPGPILCVNEGDTVTVVLHNALSVDTSITFPGQSNVLANGAPVEPQFDAQGELTSLVASAAANGGSMTYSFVAQEPGTYVYQSGTNSALQMQMGLWGALVVRPAMGADYAYNDITTRFKTGQEYMVMLSEIDPILHQTVEQGLAFDMGQYQARYFLINGRTFPDSLAPNNASWLPNQPYSSLAYIHPFDEIAEIDDGTGTGNMIPNPAYNPYPALDRIIGMGVEGYPFHPHAFNAVIVARDGRLLQTPGIPASGATPAVDPQEIYEERFSIPVNPGQTSDALYSWTDRYKWDVEAPAGSNSELPVDVPNQQNLPPGLFYGSPFLGNQDTVPVAGHSFNQCGEFYHIAHNHNLQQITGWGVVLIGQITFTRIDPPLPNNCQ